MKQSPILRLPADAPCEMIEFARDARIFDSSCSPEARVYYIEKENGFYLKRAAKGTLAREAEMTAYFHSKGIGAKVVSYLCDACDWLLTTRVAGEDCTFSKYLDDPKRLCDTIAERLRWLHSMEHLDCPVQDRMRSYFTLADEHYRTGEVDLSYYTNLYGESTVDEVYRIFAEGRDAFRSDTLLHGDYCLPNIMLDDWRFSGFIDLGNGGVGDRHVDLYWGAWTLCFNLGTDQYRSRFFDVYGRDLVDQDLLRIVAAAEVFG